MPRVQFVDSAWVARIPGPLRDGHAQVPPEHVRPLVAFLGLPRNLRSALPQ
jgi:hypothetical protein